MKSFVKLTLALIATLLIMVSHADVNAFENYATCLKNKNDYNNNVVDTFFKIQVVVETEKKVKCFLPIPTGEVTFTLLYPVTWQLVDCSSAEMFQLKSFHGSVPLVGLTREFISLFRILPNVVVSTYGFQEYIDILYPRDYKRDFFPRQCFQTTDGKVLDCDMTFGKCFGAPISGSCNVKVITGECDCNTEFNATTMACSDVNECASPSTNTCGPTAICKNRNDFAQSGTGYDCECNPGLFYDTNNGRKIRNAQDGKKDCVRIKVEVESSSEVVFFQYTGGDIGIVTAVLRRESPDGLSFFPVLNGNKTLSGANWAGNFPFLIPGAKYQLTFQQGQLELLTLNVRTSCACSRQCKSFSDCKAQKVLGNGEPDLFTARQNLGKIVFSWRDQSHCDDSFQITRTSSFDTKPSTFASLYSVNSACFASHGPESVQDSISRSKLIVGAEYNYSIQALSINPFMPKYESILVSAPSLRIKWESMLRVKVLNKGGKGVVDVKIGCFNGAIPLRCSLVGDFVLTTQDGIAVVHIMDDFESDSPRNIDITFSKTTKNITHTFAIGQDDALVTSVAVNLRHLEFDQTLTITDTTSVPISGRISVANTQDCSYSTNSTSSNLEVCTVDVTVNQNPSLECTKPDPFTGEYRLSATIGTRVGLSVKDGENHIFNRTGANITFPLEINVNQSYSRIDFIDIATRLVNISFVGGQCDIPLGNAEFDLFLAASNCKVNVQPIRQDDLITYVANFPLHDIRVKLRVVKDGNSIITESSDIVEYFADGQVLSLNAETLRFEYHPTPNKIEVLFNFLGNVAGTNCANHVAVNSGDMQSVIVSVKENYPKSQLCQKVSANVHWENKLGDEPDLINAQRLSSANPEKYALYDICFNGVPIERCTFSFNTTKDFSFSEFQFVPGHPDSSPRKIVAKVTILFQNLPVRTIIKEKDAFILGMIKTEELFAVQLPTHDPLLVIRDPPGARSFASYENVKSKLTIKSSSHKLLKSEYLRSRIGSKVKLNAGDCKGLGYAVCNEYLDGEVVMNAITKAQCGSKIAKEYNLQPPHCTQHLFGAAPGASAGAVLGTALGVGLTKYGLISGLTAGMGTFGVVGIGAALGGLALTPANEEGTAVKILEGTANENSISLGFSWSVTTSSAFGTPGKESDMFMIPTSSINFAKADVFSWNPTSCSIINVSEIVWDLSKEVPAIGFVSYSHVKNHELPELEKIRNFEMSKGSDVSRLNESIANWKNLISNHDDWHNAARENKTLTGFTKTNTLVSPQLQKNVNSLNPVGNQQTPTLAPTKNPVVNNFYHDASVFDQDTLEEIAIAQKPAETNRIVFSGGGSSYTFKENSLVSLSSTKADIDKTKHTKDTLTGVKFSANILAGYSLMGGVDLDISFDNSVELDDKVDNTNSTGAATEVSFTLSDPDASDYFVVDVYRDPKFGTFAFHTIAGESKCPHEPGTIAIEEPEFRISKKPLHPILPGEQGEIEVEFRNKGSGKSSFELFMSNLENSGGLDIPHLRSPMALSGLSRERPSKHVFKVYRGPELYEYPPFNIGLRSVCESGIASQETISLSFLEACPSANLEVSSEYSFISKISSVEQGMQVFFSNPSQPYKAFSQVQRLQSISLEYRLISEMFVARTESLGWIPALGMNGQVLNLKTQENEGFVIWNTLVLPDGVYEYRLRSKCVPWTGQGKVSNGVNEFISESARLLIDKQSPKVSGSYEPADLVYFPGDELSVTFSENLDCAKPYPFIVKLNVHGMPLDTFEVNKNLAVFCEGNRISMDLDFDSNGSIKFKDLMQKNASFYIEGVRDIAGNLCEKRIVHDFKFANIDQSKATIAVKNIQITGIADFANGLYVPGSPDWNTAAQQILEKFSQDKLIPLTRLKMESFTYDNAAQVFIATILVLPETQESLNGRRLQQQKSQEDLATQLTLAGLSIDLIPGTQDLEEQAPAKSTVVFQSGSSQRELSELKSSFEASMAKLEASIQELKETPSSSNSNNSNGLFIGLGVGLGSSFVLFGGLFLHSRRRMQQQIDEHRKSLPVVTLQHSTPALKAHVNV